MGLGVQHPVVQADQARVAEQEAKVLQCLGEPEALHVVLLAGQIFADHQAPVVPVLIKHFHGADQSGVAEHGADMLDDRLKHGPADAAPVFIARHPPHDEDRLDRLGPQLVRRISHRQEPGGEMICIAIALWTVRRHHLLMPICLVPLALRPVVIWAGQHGICLKHDSRGTVQIGPDTAVGDLFANRKVVGSVEDA